MVALLDAVKRKEVPAELKCRQVRVERQADREVKSCPSRAHS